MPAPYPLGPSAYRFPAGGGSTGQGLPVSPVPAQKSHLRPGGEAAQNALAQQRHLQQPGPETFLHGVHTM